ncbi:uncharacterized protein LOC116553202, partial [Sapajus apella]|uniref:Uncharacterized protein LOC116553202 n=1 Tax=Sapajus apella TaxID=9515 RepID=A0A6J3I141_SAPAP
APSCLVLVHFVLFEADSEGARVSEAALSGGATNSRFLGISRGKCAGGSRSVCTWQASLGAGLHAPPRACLASDSPRPRCVGEPATARPATVKQRRRWGRRAHAGEAQPLNHPLGPALQFSPSPQGAPRAGQRLPRGRMGPTVLLGKGHLGLPGGSIVLRYPALGRQPRAPTCAPSRRGAALWWPLLHRMQAPSGGQGGLGASQVERGFNRAFLQALTPVDRIGYYCSGATGAAFGNEITQPPPHRFGCLLHLKSYGSGKGWEDGWLYQLARDGEREQPVAPRGGRKGGTADPTPAVQALGGEPMRFASLSS